MKLQGPNRSQVQSLGRHNVTLTKQAGKATELAGLTAGATDALNAGAQASAQITDINNRRQGQQSGLYSQKSEAEFWEKWGGKDFYDVDELPEDVVTEGMQTKGRIASAEVLPQMYETHMKDSINQASKIIENENARGEWHTQANEVLFGRMGKIQADANANIERQIFADQKLNYGNAIEQRRPDLALQIANDMDGSPTEVAEFKRLARETAETIQYEDQIITKDVDEMIASVEYLRQEHETYTSENGQLDDTGRIVWINKLEAAIVNETKETTSRDKANEELIKREISITTANAKAGKQTDMAVYADLYKRAEAMNITLGGSLAAEMANLEKAVEFSHQVNLLNKGNSEERTAYINDWSESSSMPDFEKDERVRQLEKANAQQTVAENTDMMQSSVDSGAVQELTPVNVENGTAAEIAEQLVIRKKQHDSLEQRYGVSQGYLTKNEVEKLSSQFTTKSPKKQLEFLRATTQTLGRDAINLYSQMQVQGAGSLAIAGNVAINGTEAQAQRILEGNDFRRNSGEDVSDLSTLIELKLQTTIGKAYWNNAQYNKNIKDAVTDAYIGYTLSEGGSVKDLISLDTSGFMGIGDGKFQRSVDAVTGGMVEFNGEVTPPPVYGMNQAGFDDWTDTMSPAEIDLNGGVGGELSTEAFLEKFRDDDFTMEEYKKLGSYVIRKDDGTYLQNKAGTILTIKYRPNFIADPKVKKLKWNTRINSNRPFG